MVKIEPRGRPGPSVQSAATGTCELTCVHVPGASCLGASCPGRRGGGRAERPLRPEGAGAAVCGPALAELPQERWPGPPQCRELSRPLRGCGVESLARAARL